MPNTLRTAIEVLQAQGFRKFLGRSKKWVFSADYNSEIKSVIKSYADQYKIFVDAGAGIGEITFDVAPEFQKCLAFEPYSDNYLDFKNNLEKSKLTNIKLFNVALGKTEEKKEFFLSKTNRWDNRFGKTDDELFETSVVDVNALDDVFLKLDETEKCIIKMDVEGSEPDVMKGATQILKRGCIIITEFWPWGMYLNKSDPLDFVKFMKSYDYLFYDLKGKPFCF